MFGTTNSIEPVQVAVSRPAERRAPDEPPIREATRADLAGAARRREAEGEDPVRLAPAAKAGLFRRAPAEPVQPDAVAKRHGLYVAEKRGTRTYFADYQQKREVMRADPKRITTKTDDRQTVGAVLDLAQDRGWSRIRLRGTEDFKREAWVQAQVRGIAAEGYKPSATDEQEAARRKVAAAPSALPEKAAAAPTQAKAGPAAPGVEVPVQVKPKAAEVAAPAAQAARAIPAEAIAKAAGQAAAAPAPGSLAEHNAKLATMTPEQRDAVSRAALGMLHPSRAAERQKAVWGSVEDAGRASRATEAAQTVKATAGERRSAAETA